MWMEGKPWTAIELHELELAKVERMTIHQIARCLMRNPNEVSMKVWEIGLARARLKHGSPEHTQQCLE
jgi:hypothetical protein